MSFIFGGGGGSTQQSSTTQTPVYGPQAQQLMGRDIDLLTSLLLPIQRAQSLQDYRLMAGLPGAGPTPVQAGANLIAPVSGPAVDPFQAQMGALNQAYLSQLPFSVAERTRSIVPQQYLSLFAPNVRSESTSEVEQETDPFMAALQVASIAAPFFAGCWVADALYGEKTIQAQCARLWVCEGWQGWEADAFRAVYRRVGPTLAALIRRMPGLGRLVRPLFDRFVVLGWAYWCRSTCPIWG
jgi:hypothetical protein